MKNASVTQVSSARIPNQFGEYQLYVYENSEDDKEHLALVYGDVSGRSNVMVRVHSECFTGDVLGSQRCDCGEQLNRAMQLIAEEGAGVILYMRQEGRGIGLSEKLRAYNLQDQGHDTVEANLLLGHQADSRDYTVAALMLEDLGISSVRLLTNNPSKIEQLSELGISIVSREPLTPILVNEQNRRYLFTKMTRMSHMFDLPSRAQSDDIDFVRAQ
ncbi:MAG: GTP cyclohydrolase II [Alkalispirochaetaceae bacterium]